MTMYTFIHIRLEDIYIRKKVKIQVIFIIYYNLYINYPLCLCCIHKIKPINP